MDGVVVAGLAGGDLDDRTPRGVGRLDGLPMLLSAPPVARKFESSLLEPRRVDEAGDGVVVLGNSELLAVQGVEFEQGLGAAVSGDIAQVSEIRQHPFGRVELEVWAVHPEHVWQLIPSAWVRSFVE